ncbi:MAG: glycosyltransferase family 39 protein [Phycisphaeraceae bacterium]|nr:glycosyltransferase family 39 protein [Phycisphaeraceae bacterium]
MLAWAVEILPALLLAGVFAALGASQRSDVARHVCFLSSLSMLLFLIAPTAIGLMSTQESLRVLSARDMWDRGDWLTPTIHGQPYLDKPPLLNWLQLLAGAMLGTGPTDFTGRLIAGLAAWAGVLATYFAGTELLRDGPQARRWAFWGALMLATGLLFVRSSRAVVIDNLLPPLTIGAIGFMHCAWRQSDAGKSSAWLPMLAAATCALAAMLAKGPPGAMVVFLAAVFAPFVLAGGTSPRTGVRSAAGVAAAMIAVLGTFLHPQDQWAAVAPSAIIGFGVGWVLAGPFWRGGPAMVLRGWRGTQPLVLIAIGFGGLALWMYLASRAVDMPLFRAAEEQASENLTAFRPGSIAETFTALLYGAGLGSIGAIATLGWIAWRREPLSRGLALIFAALFLGAAAYAFIGRGSPRYLTPLWPVLAVLAAWGLRRRILALGPCGPRHLAGVGVTLTILAIVEIVWYGGMRSRVADKLSPRTLVRALLADPEVADLSMAMLDVWMPAVDIYAQRHVMVVTEHMRPMDYPAEPQNSESLFVRLQREGRMIVFGCERHTRNRPRAIAPKFLEAHGFRVTRLAVGHSFYVQDGDVPIVAWLVEAP